MHSHTKIIIIVFFWNFGIVPGTQTFFLCFKTAYKTHHIYVMNKPLVDQNVLGLTLALCIVFITDLFTWLDVKNFDSTEARQFCFRLKVMARSVGILISHVVNPVCYIW